MRGPGVFYTFRKVNKMSIEGHCFPAELDVLDRYARIAEPPFLEIGCMYGRSTLALAAHGTVWAIDPHTEFNSWEGFLKNIRDADVIPVKDYSYNVEGMFQDHEAGLLFIDGAHTYDAVRMDLQLFVPKVRPGGYLLMHNVHESGSEPVRNALKDFMKTCPGRLEHIESVRRTWIGAVK